MSQHPYRVLYISFGILIVDQATKLQVKGVSLPFLNFYHSGLELGSSVPFLGNIVRLTFIENPGMVFGLQIGSQRILALVSIAASICVFYYIHKMRDRLFVVRASLAVILGGALGNLVDRTFYGIFFGYGSLFYGRVVDFIDVNVFHLSRFGIFNVADASVTVGVVLLLVFHRALDEPARQLAVPIEVEVATASLGRFANRTIESKTIDTTKG